ncbi:MAG: transcriptional regulator [Candidatus Solibacter sp.]|nr:transcriptional regulator [Candidatus Solibacter sp.]
MSNDIRRLKSEILQALAHPTRIAIVEELRRGELTAGALSGKLGLDQANASQHLALLRSRQIVAYRKEGSQVIYSLKDPALGEVLDVLKRICKRRLEETMDLLDEIGEGRHAAR